jgi:hypothetical protein
MRLSETIFFSLAVATFIIGVHQSFFIGVVESYWLFMLAAIFLLTFRYIKHKNMQDHKNNLPDPKAKQHVAKRKSSKRK